MNDSLQNAIKSSATGKEYGVKLNSGKEPSINTAADHSNTNYKCYRGSHIHIHQRWSKSKHVNVREWKLTRVGSLYPYSCDIQTFYFKYTFFRLDSALVVLILINRLKLTENVFSNSAKLLYFHEPITEVILYQARLSCN